EIVCAPPGKPEELPGEILDAVRNVITPALIGLNVSSRTKGGSLVDAVLKGRPWTKAGINNALYDLQAKALDTSVLALMGGRVNDRIPVMGTVLGIDAPDRMAERAADTVAAGFRAVKVKIGENIASDIARVAAVRDAIGSEISLRVDANDHYRPAEAIRLIRAIEPFDIEHVEQPISRRDLLGMVEIRKAVDVPIMTDDMVATPEEAMTVIRLGAADRVKIKVTKHGLDGARLIADMLAAAGMTAVLGHVFEMGLAAVAEAHVAAAVPNLAGPHEIGSMRPMGSDADIIVEDLRAEPGFLRLPGGPGLGVNLDWARISEMRAKI
ncbi:MAG: enolase C-terminal domain-like protein, partial [Rhodospirillales bacterium]